MLSDKHLDALIESRGILKGLHPTLGITAITVTRPLPYIGAPRPDVRDLVGDAISLGDAKG